MPAWVRFTRHLVTLFAFSSGRTLVRIWHVMHVHWLIALVLLTPSGLLTYMVMEIRGIALVIIIFICVCCALNYMKHDVMQQVIVVCDPSFTYGCYSRIVYLLTQRGV